jgi:DNA-binding IclR family transcriptional regulator
MRRDTLADLEKRREVGPVKALAHAIDVLEALAERGEMGVSELSRATGLSKTAVFNILATFERRRLVARDPATARYRLGWRLYELGTELVRRNELAPIARPFLKELVERAGETALLGILDGDGVTYVDRYESAQRIRMVAAPGRQSPLHATASGKVLLAHQPQEYVERILAGELRRYTATTITDPDVLRAQLRDVVDHGFARCQLEHEPELSSISVPVFDYSGHVAAALTLAAPAFRFTDTAMRRVLPTLMDVAGELTQQLGGGARAAQSGGVA